MELLLRLDDTMSISKVIYDGTPLIDLTNDTVTPDTLSKGTTAHGRDGELIVGTSTSDSIALSIFSGNAYVSNGTLYLTR